MKILTIFSIFLIISLSSFAQKTNSNYDSTLAKKLGADEYGMKLYVFVMLKTGTGIEENKAIRDSLFGGHLANIERLVDLKKMIVAGPMMKNEKNYRGIFRAK